MVRLFRLASTNSSRLASARVSISEIIVYNYELSDEELISVNYYLSQKWSIGYLVDSDQDGLADDDELSLKFIVRFDV